MKLPLKLVWILPLLLCLLAISSRAQQGNTVILQFPGAPTGSCAPIQLANNTATGDHYNCLAGAWNKVNGTSGTTGAPVAGVFNWSTTCGGLANCFQGTDDDSTDNCGSALTTWVAAVNAYAGKGVATVNIYGTTGYKLTACNVVFTNAHGVTITGPAVIDCAQALQSCIQFGATTTSNMAFTPLAIPPVYRVQNLTFIGGTVLTGSGGNGSTYGGAIYAMPLNAVLYVTNVNFFPSGANAGFGANATNGTCTNYAIFFDAAWPNGFVEGVNIQSNSSGTTAGGCGIGIPFGASLGSDTVMISNTNIYTDGEANGSGQCGSIGINDGGSLGAENNVSVYGFGIPELVTGIGHKVTESTFDSTQCAAGGVSATIQYGGSGAVGPATFSNNTFQTGATFGGHAANPFAIQNGSSATVTGWTITNNLQNLVSNPTIFAANTNCTPLGTKACLMAGNQNMVSLTPCGTNNTGWEAGTIVAECFPTATANLTTQTLFTPINGMYHVSCQIILLTAGTTSTLPTCVIQYKDAFSAASVSQTITPAWAPNTAGCTGTTSNTIGNSCQGAVDIAPASSAALTFTTANYASTGSAMSYYANVTVQSANQ